MTKPTAYRVARRIERQYPNLRAVVIPDADDEEYAVWAVQRPGVPGPRAAYMTFDGRQLQRVTEAAPDSLPIRRERQA